MFQYINTVLVLLLWIFFGFRIFTIIPKIPALIHRAYIFIINIPALPQRFRNIRDTLLERYSLVNTAPLIPPIVMRRRGGGKPPIISTIDPTLGPLPTQVEPQDGYKASPWDIFIVRRLLGAAGRLPVEVIERIMDSAEYWAFSSTRIDYTTYPQGSLIVRGAQPVENTFLLRTNPIGLPDFGPINAYSTRPALKAPYDADDEHPRSRWKTLGTRSDLVHPVRKVIFIIRSRDQGWGGEHENHGTFRGSYTWFDAGLERFANELNPLSAEDEGLDDSSRISWPNMRSVWPPVYMREDGVFGVTHALFPDEDHMVQRNRLADRNVQTHRVEWRWNDDIDSDSQAANVLERNGRGRGTGNGQFVRDLKFGDIITVWARARFSSWANIIETVEIQVYWAL